MFATRSIGIESQVPNVAAPILPQDGKEVRAEMIEAAERWPVGSFVKSWIIPFQLVLVFSIARKKILKKLRTVVDWRLAHSTTCWKSGLLGTSSTADAVVTSTDQQSTVYKKQ